MWETYLVLYKHLVLDITNYTQKYVNIVYKYEKYSMIENESGVDGWTLATTQNTVKNRQ